MLKKRLLITLVIALLGMLVPYSVSAATNPNYAQGKPYTASVTCTSSFGNVNTLVTDGNKYSSAYITDNATGGSSPVSLTIDMKAVYTLNEIKVWHYSADGRTFHNTKTEISEDNVTWTPVFDSAATGSAEYVETENGKVHLFQPVKARYIRDWINGSDKDSENRWVEIQAFGPQQTGNDVKQIQPLNDSLESIAGITGSNPGTITLTQDRVGGNYAVKVVAGDAASDSVNYNLTASDPFNIAQFRKIKLWVKPEAGAQWIKFYTHDNTNNVDYYFINDLDGDGVFKVGTDLESGKWNQVILDLSKVKYITSTPPAQSMVQAKNLSVQTNDISTWLYDEISSVYSPTASIDLTKMTDSKTDTSSNELRFKSNTAQSGANTYDTTPTVLLSGKVSELNKPFNTQADLTASGYSTSGTTVDNQGNIQISANTSYTNTATNTSDFSGTHDGTIATNDSVKLITGDSYTKLLLHMDGSDNGTTFTDETGKTVTRNGNTCTKTGTKKFGTASAYFDGNGDYLSIPDSADWNFGSDNFTIDCWVKRDSLGAFFPIIKQGAGSPNDDPQWSLLINSSNKVIFYVTNPNLGVVSTRDIDTDWNHISVVRSGSTITLYINGIASGSGTAVAMPDLSYTVEVGRGYYPSYLTYASGYIDEICLSKGIARWTSNFTSPTLPYSYNNTKLLMHMDGIDNGTTFTDETGKIVTKNGDTCTKTARKKLGASSAYFAGNTSDYITLADSTDWDLSSGNSSIDFWIYPLAYRPTYGSVIICRGALTGWYFMLRPNGTCYLTCSNNTVDIDCSAVIGLNQWTHVAVVRYSSITTLYINGNSVGTTSKALANVASPFKMGGWDYNTNYQYNGYIDEICLLKGIARWTSNFTPPTAPGNSYTHSTLDLSSGGTANPATITFNKTTPANTSLTVEVTTDGGNTWVAKNSGDSLFPNGTNLTGKTVQWRANLSSSDPAVSPSLDDITISVSSGYPTTESYTYVSPEINISSAGTASSSSITWTPYLPTVNGSSVGTVEVQTNVSSDGTFPEGNWQTVTNGGAIPGLPIGTDLDNYKLKYKVTLSTTDPSVTPSVNNINIDIKGPLQGGTSLDDKITGISISSGYVTTTGPITAPAQQRTYLSGISPTVLSISGDGNSVYYKNPSDNKLYLLNLLTGVNSKISDTLPAAIKTNYDGTKAAFTDASNNLYLYNSANSGSTTTISANITDFDIQKDGTVYYATTAGAVYCYQSSMTAPGTSCKTGLTISHLTVSKTGNQVFYSNAATLNTLTLTPAGWISTLLATAANNISGLWSNLDGSMIYFKTSDGLFEYRVASKATRSVEVDTSTVINITDDNKLAILGTNNEFRLYDANTDSATGIRPGNASGTAFDVDDSGQKMAYVASDGLASNWINGVQKPERYLLSLDGKNSWYTFKNAKWQLVKSGGIPTIDDLKNNGMTIDQVNAITEQDFNSLYTNGKEIYSIDVAVYMASPDAFTTPSLKGIVISLKGNLSLDSADGQIPLQKPLYTMKQQSFNSTKWRQMKKIYPVELYPREGETYYFISTDGTNFQTYKNGAWQTVDPALLSDVENKWIDLTQKGMTAQELRSIPADALNMLLPADSITVGYIQKVQDMSTQGYTSQISIDYVEAEYESANLVLKVNLTDNTVKTYTGLTKSEVEDFTAWIAQRQANKGPLFHKIKTKSTIQGVIQVNEYINYYMIQYFSVEEMS